MHGCEWVIAGSTGSWLAYNDSVLARMWAMISNVHAVYGEDCRVLRTCSYCEGSRFYPFRVDPNKSSSGGDLRECFPADIGGAFFEGTLSDDGRKQREDASTGLLLDVTRMRELD